MPPFSSHWYPLADEEVRITEFPSQIVVGPFALIVGVAGEALTVTVILPQAPALEQPPSPRTK